jgi:hypothetical protein
MAMKFARTGIAALMLTSAAMAGCVLPAQAAQARPGIHSGVYEYTYFSNAQHTTVVGVYFSPGNLCGTSYGKETAYYTVTFEQCGPS